MNRPHTHSLDQHDLDMHSPSTHPSGTNPTDIVITVAAPGGVDQLRVTPRDPQAPGAGEVRLRHQAIGVNFVDTYHRRGLYPLPGNVPGVEGVGVIEALGAGVTGLTVGQRVAYAGTAGGYASTRLLPADRALPLPDAVSSRDAAASLLRGLTTQMLLAATHAVGPHTVLLVSAAAGGLGIMVTRWARQLGARVIGTASTAEKAALARHHGADAVIIGRDADVAAEVASLTGGRGVDYAIDGVGGDALPRFIAATRSGGTVASIGRAGGPVAVEAAEGLARDRGVTFTRPSILARLADIGIYHAAATEVMAQLARGLTADIGGSYPLAEAAQAHAALEAGRTTGALLLLP
ncbi:NADPH2:quinone reductase [Nitrospirillum amazonense]|uniref:NADPH2:quinone reductase n=1 Tax=Nitrospirillum amazonense TaxID=28077 RepID=A0A560JUG8_9PROT|nr:quinone oxidoreductase [Nitrospirillum amazonense]TWB73144.1 NADPH2:quinone reductase [Nitrospirillum amazonense]